ncbi:unnamed protein product [Cylicostephanus goldi]|uniref:Uncharacterized protein n=1 Tax=Cylicostephanus goldi TaxID=71465 RepID=A0A3P7QG08_CYLGO|nr:unnamed protein product [Cylicostephanus goldi]
MNRALLFVILVSMLAAQTVAQWGPYGYGYPYGYGRRWGYGGYGNYGYNRNPVASALRGAVIGGMMGAMMG